MSVCASVCRFAEKWTCVESTVVCTLLSPFLITINTFSNTTIFSLFLYSPICVP